MCRFTRTAVCLAENCITFLICHTVPLPLLLLAACPTRRRLTSITTHNNATAAAAACPASISCCHRARRRAPHRLISASAASSCRRASASSKSFTMRTLGGGGALALVMPVQTLASSVTQHRGSGHTVAGCDASSVRGKFSGHTQHQGHKAGGPWVPCCWCSPLLSMVAPSDW